MNVNQEVEIHASQFLAKGALLSLFGRLACTVVLLAGGFAGLAFLVDAQSTGPSKLQVNDTVQLYMDAAQKLILDLDEAEAEAELST